MMMQSKQLKSLIRAIIQETLQVLSEAENGEWWIYPGGDVQFADGSVGDSNHEGYVIDYVTREIYEHFVGDSNEEMMGYLENWEEDIFKSLISDGRLSEEEIQEWKEGDGPAPVLVKKLLEDNVYKTLDQAKFAVFGAYGMQSKDMRDYAMKYLGWKRMTTHMGVTYIQTWYLTQEDLNTIRRGIDNAWEWSDEKDKENNHFIYIEVMSNHKEFNDIPLDVLDKASVQDLIQYQCRNPWMKEQHMTTGWINEGIFHEHKDWIVYEGDNKITTIFQDNSRLSFEVGYPRGTWGEDKLKWKRRAASKWKSLAREIYNSQGLSEGGNPIVKPWAACFREALEHPDLQEFKRKDAAPVFDPVNLSPR